MITTHKIQEIGFENNFIKLTVDGQKVKVALDKVSAKLMAANEMQRNLYKISASGYGIHWALIDEDLSVDALLKLAE